MPASKESRPFLDPRGASPTEGSIKGPQGDGRSFPLGYDAQLPCEGQGTYDIVVHVGVGRPGAIAIEKIGRKRGYDKPDIRGEMAPYATNQRRSRPFDGDTEAERAESRNFVEAGLTLPSDPSSRSIIRGFGQGYEEYPEEFVNSVDTSALVDWLVSERGFKDIRESHDAGRFLCDFIVSSRCIRGSRCLWNNIDDSAPHSTTAPFQKRSDQLEQMIKIELLSSSYTYLHSTIRMGGKLHRRSSRRS